MPHKMIVEIDAMICDDCWTRGGGLIGWGGSFGDIEGYMIVKVIRGPVFPGQGAMISDKSLWRSAARSSLLIFTRTMTSQNLTILNQYLLRSQPSTQSQLTNNPPPRPNPNYQNAPKPSIAPLSASSRLSLPSALFSHYENMKFKCFMGIFEEIERCWISIDNKFFVWSFDQKDFTIYEELDQIILSVGLVKPKRGIFKEYVEYLLILATPVEVQIIAVVFDQGELTLLPTNYSISTDNVNMLQICGTDHGRIFLCGADGHLYELIYESKSGFFRRKVRKLNHTQNFFGNLMPSFLKWTNDEPIIDISIDNSRNILYTLSENSTIDVWYLGTHGEDMQRIVSYSNAFKDAQRFSSVDSSTSADLNPLLNKQNFKLVYIKAISKLDSESQYTLVAVSKQGQHYYFSAIPSVFQSKPNGLRLVQLRYTQLKNVAGADALDLNAPISDVHECFYKNGVFLFADATTDEKDRLIGVCLESSGQKQDGDDFSSSGLDVYESTHVFDVQGKTLAIAERPLRLAISFGKNFETNQPYNELATQHYYPPREFVCLSNTGIQMIRKYRPVDMLKLILQDTSSSSESGDNADIIKNFFQEYGRDEACYMCLLIACSGADSFADQTSSFATNSEMVRKAKDLFFTMGGEATPPKRSTSYSTSLLSGGMGGPIAAPSVTYSSAHNALMLYFSRMIAPMWFSPIVVGREYTINGTKKYEIASVRFQNKEISFVKNRLKGLDQFLGSTPFLYGSDMQSYRYSGSRGGVKPLFGHEAEAYRTNAKQLEEAQRLEQQSIYTLYNANKRCIQILTFLEILNKFNLVRLLRGVNPNILKSLEGLLFSHFVWKQDSGMMKDLIRLIVRKSDDEEVGAVDALFKQLETEVGNFFTAADIKECEGFEKLNLVRKTTDETTAGALRQRALSAFMDAIKYAGESHGHIDIGPVCRQFRKLGDYSSAVKLALYAAQAVDPNDLAYEVLQPSQNETSAAREAYKKRTTCYAAALEALEELYNPEPLRESSKQSLKELPRKKLSGDERELMRNRILAEMTKSPDRLFHVQLFNWYIQNRKDQEGLLKLPSPYLEEFLRNNYPHSQLLARYYEHHEKWDQAAKVLSQLADSTDDELNLDTRIAQLTRAINCAKTGNTAGNMLQVLQNRLDVALVQKSVLVQLRQSLTEGDLTPQERDDREKAIKELDNQFQSLTDLYNKYSVRFQLFEASLAILHCSQFKNQQPIFHLWVQIVVSTISKSQNVQSALISKLTTLGRKYYPSMFFPVDFVVSMVEKLTFRYNFEPGWLAHAFVDPQVIIPHEELYRAYKLIHLHLVNREEYPLPFDIDPKYYLLTPSDDTRRYILATLIEILELWTQYASKSEDVDFSPEIFSSDLGMLESDAGRLSTDVSVPQNKTRDALLRRIATLRRRWTSGDGNRRI